MREPIIQSHVPLTYTDSEHHDQPMNPLTSEHLTRSLEVQTDLSYVQECIEMRKERIVFLFLEHWRKYTMTEAYKCSGRGKTLSVEENDSHSLYYHNLAKTDGTMQMEDDQLLYFMKQRQVVGNLLGHWRTIMSQVPTRQIRRLSRAQMILLARALPSPHQWVSGSIWESNPWPFHARLLPASGDEHVAHWTQFRHLLATRCLTD